MPSFPIDDDVVELVQAKANPAPFESFSNALRRILISASPDPAAMQPSIGTVVLVADPDRDLSRGDSERAEPPIAANSSVRASGPQRSRARKADLKELVRKGLLKEGQELVFVDFRGQHHPDQRAKIAGGDLLFEGQRGSMSSLASRLLKKMGYVADSVRGPDHWATPQGQKVRTLWERLPQSRRA
jgi:hypothetical protein